MQINPVSVLAFCWAVPSAEENKPYNACVAVVDTASFQITTPSIVNLKVQVSEVKFLKNKLLIRNLPLKLKAVVSPAEAFIPVTSLYPVVLLDLESGQVKSGANSVKLLLPDKLDKFIVMLKSPI